MAIVTNNVQPGIKDGMDKGVTGSQLGAPEQLIYVNATPDAVIAGLGSQIAHDVNADELYMCEADGAANWIHLISGT